MKTIPSPIADNSKAIRIQQIPTKKLIDGYKTQFGIDVKAFFKNREYVGLYKCESTGFKFFYPYTLAGDDIFYQQLSRYDWYYMDWKWEHEVAASIITSKDTVLEIGCGDGNFISHIATQVKQADGIELNTKAQIEAAQRGLRVYPTTIESFAKKNKKYSVVCYFQVLEHIAQAGSFIESSLKCLNRNGHLIISVPNHYSNSILLTEDTLLDYPPHHMGWWNATSFANLARLYNLRINQIYEEPLQNYHMSAYTKHISKKLSKHCNLLGLEKHIIPRLSKIMTKIYQPYLPGHTIVVDFIKL